MSYRTGNRSNYQQEHTLIEDLPDLVDTNYNIDKFIRKTHKPYTESSMEDYSTPEYSQSHDDSYHPQHQPQHQPQHPGLLQHQHQHQYQHQQLPMEKDAQSHSDLYTQQQYNQPRPLPHIESYTQPYQLSCVETSEHCQSCPVCKKLYSSDNTIYIIIIVILAIICILLLKKVLDV